MFIILVMVQKKKKKYGINSVNPLNLMINRIKGHFEEKDGKRCLFISPDKIQKNHKVFD